MANGTGQHTRVRPDMIETTGGYGDGERGEADETC